jgi:membrane protease YdiL (CAAX protease family)
MTMSASLRSLIHRHPLFAYFAITYVLTWSMLLPVALSARGVLPIHLPAWWHALGAAGPLCAAFLVTRIVGGSPAVRDWLSGFVRWRVDVRWWLLAVASPFALFFVSALIVRIFGVPWPNFARLAAPGYANGVWLFDLLFVGTFAYAIGEEPGWRGFALP